MATDDAPPLRAGFAARLSRDLLGAISVFGVALGEELGLYSSLDVDGPATSAELARRTGISERYAREWLEQQAADGILALASPSDDPESRRYLLPPDHRDFLADRGHLDFMAPVARRLVAGIIQTAAIGEAFRSGGGVPWEHYGTSMREAQADANRPFFLQALPGYVQDVPDVHERLLSTRRPARIGEVGSGLGWAAIGFALAYPHVTVDGYDLDVASVEQARLNAHEAGVEDRVRFHLEDGAEAGGQYDLVLALDSLHHMPQPVAILAAMRAMMAPGAACLVMDANVGDAFTVPASELERLMYGLSLLVCLPDGLSHTPSVATGAVMRPSTFRHYAEQAGFADVEILAQLEHPLFRFYRLHG